MSGKTIIKYDNMTQEDIQNSIDAYLKQNYDFQGLSGYKALDIVTELLAGFGSYIAYNNQTLREETYLETVKSKSSISLLAIDYSYRINRPVSPKLKLEYTGNYTKNIFRGDVFGSYEGMQLVYTGSAVTLTTGSTFNVSIGELKKTTKTIDKTEDLWFVDLHPESKAYIENNIISISANQLQSRIVTRLEDLYLGNAVDFSLGNDKARIFLYDAKFNRGFSTSDIGAVDIAYLEVDGSFDFITSKAQIDKEFKLNTILSQGSAPDNLYYVKSILPFFNQTFRTAVSPTDFNYIVKNFNYFKDAAYQFDQGTPVRYRLRLKHINLGEEFTITLFSNKGAHKDDPLTEEYKITVLEDETYDTFVSRITSIIEAQTSLAEFVKPSVGPIFRLQSFKTSSELEIYVSNNIEIIVEIPNRLPNLYMGYIYYTHKQITSGITELTYFEQQQFKTFFEPHKISGHVVALVPAAKNGYDLDLHVKIKSDEYTSVFNTLLTNYLDAYQYTLNKDMSVKKMLRDISLFSFNGVRFVTEVFSQTDIDYVGYIDRYLSINVSLDLSYES